MHPCWIKAFIKKIWLTPNGLVVVYIPKQLFILLKSCLIVLFFVERYDFSGCEILAYNFVLTVLVKI